MFGKEELEAVTRVMKRGILSAYQGNYSKNFYGGEEIRNLEAEWASFFNVKYAIAVNSATSGLWCALNAIGVNSCDAIFVTPWSMTCSATLPLLFKATPVFVDIEEDYYCMSITDLIENYNSVLNNTHYEAMCHRPKAIIVVDLFGQPYDADAINKFAKANNMYVIEDAAQAIGATYKGKYAGTLGDIGVYSLNHHKHISCGEGGIVVTNDKGLALRIRLSMNHAEAAVNDMCIKKNAYFAEDYTDNAVTMVGMNLRMTELQAAIAREQLKKLPAILKEYRDDAKHFPVAVRPECEHSYYRYAFDPDTQGEPTGDLTEFAFKRKYITPIFQMPLFQQLGYKQLQCPVVRNTNENIVLAWRISP